MRRRLLAAGNRPRMRAEELQAFGKIGRVLIIVEENRHIVRGVMLSDGREQRI